MHNVASKTYTFDDLTYLYGPNGAGKSTVLGAIQLALLGYIPGVDKKNDALIQHAKGSTLVVKCVLSSETTDVVVTRTLVGTGRTVTKKVDIQPEGYDIASILADIELPIFNFADFMGMTANKMKEWFINFLPSENQDVAWKEELSNAVADLSSVSSEFIESTVETINSIDCTGVNLVKEVNAMFKEKMSYNKMLLERNKSTSQTLVHHEDIDNTVTSAEVNQQIADLQDKMIAITQRDAIIENNSKINEQLSKINLQYTSIDDEPEFIKLAELEKQVAAESDRVAAVDAETHNTLQELCSAERDIDNKISELDTDAKIKSNTVKNKGICPYTSNRCEAAAAIVDQTNAELEELTALRNQYVSEKTAICDRRVKAMQANKAVHDALAALKQEHAAVSRSVKALSDSYNQAAYLKVHLQVEPIIEEDLTADECRNKLAELQNVLTKVIANEQYAKLADKLILEQYALENELAALKQWEKLTSANGLQTTMMNAPFDALSADMDKWLQKMFGKKGIKSHFNLVEKANSFSFGISRDDKYIPYDLLSSGEKCLFTFAFMICILMRTESKLKLILVDDLLDHLDNANAAKLFDALDKLPNIQVIIAGVKECTAACKDKILVDVTK